MNVEKYTDEELYHELEQNEREWQYWANQDKRLKTVKYQLLWAMNITLRDRAELKRRGLPLYR